MSTIGVLQIKQFREKSGESDFYCNRLSNHLVTSHSHIEKPHKHDFYAVVLFTHGRGKHEIDFHNYDVAAGSLFFLSPGQTHNWSLSSDAEGYIVFHSKDFYDSRYANESIGDYSFFGPQRSSDRILPDSVALAGAIALFSEIYAEYTSENPRAIAMIQSLLTQLYILLQRTMPDLPRQADVNSYQFTFNRFVRQLELHFRSEKSPETYAEKLHITAKHLNRINRQLVNKTTSLLVAERVVLEAKRMLFYSAADIAQIALSLGYDDAAYFTKLFRKHTGKTPTQFRKSYS